jgi:hypothetical protein
MHTKQWKSEKPCRLLMGTLPENIEANHTSLNLSVFHVAVLLFEVYKSPCIHSNQCLFLPAGQHKYGYYGVLGKRLWKWNFYLIGFIDIN